MVKQQSDLDRVRNSFGENMILTLVRLKEILGTNSTMTVYRRLKSLSYLSSYSHRGRFYTLADIPEFNDMGIWSFQGVYFSRWDGDQSILEVQGVTPGTVCYFYISGDARAAGPDDRFEISVSEF